MICVSMLRPVALMHSFSFGSHSVLVSRVGMHRNYGAEREARWVYRPILDRLRQREQRDAPQDIDRDPLVASPSTKACVPGIASPNVLQSTTADPESSKVETVTCSIWRDDASLGLTR